MKSRYIWKEKCRQVTPEATNSFCKSHSWTTPWKTLEVPYSMVEAISSMPIPTGNEQIHIFLKMVNQVCTQCTAAVSGFQFVQPDKLEGNFPHRECVCSVDVMPPALTSRSILVGLHYSVMQKTSLMFLERVLVQLLFTCGVLAYKLWTVMKLDVTMLEYRRSLCVHFEKTFFGHEPISAADKRRITNICQSGMQRLPFHLEMV